MVLSREKTIIILKFSDIKKRLHGIRRQKLKIVDKNFSSTISSADIAINFLKLMLEFEPMWDGHFMQISIAKHWEELTPEQRKPVQSASYRADQEARKFQTSELDEMLEKKAIEPAQRKWPVPNSVLWNKHGSFRLIGDYQKLNAVTEGDSYPVPIIDKCVNSFGDALVFLLGLKSPLWSRQQRCDSSQQNWITSHTDYADSSACHSNFALHARTHTDHGRQLIIIQMAGRLGVFGLHYHLFSNFRKTRLTWLNLLVTVAHSSRPVEPEKMQGLCRKGRLLGNGIRPAQLERAFHTTDTIHDLKPPQT